MRAQSVFAKKARFPVYYNERLDDSTAGRESIQGRKLTAVKWILKCTEWGKLWARIPILRRLKKTDGVLNWKVTFPDEYW